MFSHYLAAALRHLARNRLYTAVSVLGLAVGLCVALLVALVLRNQYSHDHDVPGYQRTWTVPMVFTMPDRGTEYREAMLPRAAQQALQTPEVEAMTRVAETPAEVERDGRRWRETVHWADTQFAAALPRAAYAGDIAAALRTPDGVILSRSYARRFFGNDAPLGETLNIDGHPMVVRALIEDPNPNATHAPREIIAAGLASFSGISEYDNAPESGGLDLISGYTYLRLKPGVDIRTLDAALVRAMVPYRDQMQAEDVNLRLEPVRIDRLNTLEALHPGFGGRMIMLGILGAVVLLIAAINFVNLQTARSTLRAREVAIRRLAGARRRTLVVQFLGEALVHAGAATLLAVALAEWLLPQVNAFLDTGAQLDYRSTWLIPMLVGVAMLFGLLAGAWPAFVLSAFRPAQTLRGDAVTRAGGAFVRQGLVTLQFALLIALAICAGVVHQQRVFALNEALRVDRDQVLMVFAPRSTAFTGEARKLPGVTAVTRTDVSFLGSAGFGPLRRMSRFLANPEGAAPVTGLRIGVEFDLFDFYGIKPLAGRLPANDGASTVPAGYVVINEAAVRALGLGSVAEALEKTIPMSQPKLPVPLKVLAVVPDFSLSSVAEQVPPTLYLLPDREPSLVNLRLTGREIPETLAAIDALLVKTGNTATGIAEGPFRFFLDEHLQRQYQNVLRQSQAFGICALIAIALSCIGLFALTSAMAERRTKEIGVRKALGANTGDVLRLLLWQFSKPVLWANLIAWPVAGWAMQGWLAGFAYRIALPLWVFPVAAMAALVIALATVATHSFLVARAQPVAALRYE